MSEWQQHLRASVSVPAEVYEFFCDRAHRYEPDLDQLHVDEGDSGAMVPLTCQPCGTQSAAYWAVTDEEYEQIFGHHPDDERED